MTFYVKIQEHIVIQEEICAKFESLIWKLYSLTDNEYTDTYILLLWLADNGQMGRHGVMFKDVNGAHV